LGAAKSFEDLLMDIWVLREAEARHAALRRLGDDLVAARSRYDEGRERNDAVLGEVGLDVAT